MTNLSKGFLRGRPMKLTTNASLSQIRDALIAAPPVLATTRSGWGSIAEDPDIIGEINIQPPATSPHILPAVAGRRPDTLVARLYWFKKLRTRVRGGVQVPPQYSLAATDVLLSEDSAGEYLLFVSSLTDKDINTVVLPALSDVVTGLDAGSIIASATSSLDFDDKDFFLWLVRQFFDAAPVGVGIDIDAFDYVNVYDPLNYQTSIARGVHPDRLELVTLLASPTKWFGPAKFSITANSLGMGCEIKLSVTADFDVTLGHGGISYPPGQFTSLQDIRLQAVTDLLFVILPAMKAEYLADTAWRTGPDRDTFRTAMKTRATADVGRL